MAHRVSLREYDEACVQPTVQMLRDVRPARGARPTDDARRRVWISLPELAPWQARFDFLVLVQADTATGEPRRDAETGDILYEYVCVGSGLEGFVSIGGAEESSVEVGRAYAERRLRFNEEELRFQHIAELKARRQDSDAERLEGSTLHRDSATFARVWRSLEGTETAKTYVMAEIFGVSRTTIYNRRERALAEGKLDESDLTGRNRPRG